MKSPMVGLIACALTGVAVMVSDPNPNAVKTLLLAVMSGGALTAVTYVFLAQASATSEQLAENSRQEKIRVERDFQKLRTANEDLKKKVMEVSSLMASLQLIAKQTGQSLEYKKILTLMIDVTQRNVGAKRCSLWLVDPTTQELKLEESHGWSEAEKKDATSENQQVFDFVMEKKASLDAETMKRDPTVMGLGRDSAIPSLICVPLAVGGEVVGLLNVEEFTDSRKSSISDEVRLANFLGSLAAMSIKNARMFEQAQDKANSDGLTRLYTHRYFQEQLDQEIKRSERYGDCFSLILTDIDHFKKFNDTYGHQIGDYVLKETAQCFKTAGLDKNSILARYGGEEFIVILPHTPKPEAARVAEHLRKAVESRSYDSEQGKLTVRISLGVSTFPDDATKKSVLIEMADHALYRAKEGGRNQVQLAGPEDHPQPA